MKRIVAVALALAVLTTSWSVDGTLAVQTWATKAWFWTRGHGPSLFKAGSQLQDYRCICIAEAT